MTAYTIPQVRAALRIWAAWCYYLDSPIGPAPATCHSAESQYRPRQQWEIEAPRRPEPDRVIGERVEQIVRSIDERHAMVLRLWYCYLPRAALPTGVYPIAWCARRAYLGSEALFLQLLHWAERDVVEALDEQGYAR